MKVKQKEKRKKQYRLSNGRFCDIYQKVAELKTQGVQEVKARMVQIHYDRKKGPEPCDIVGELTLEYMWGLAAFFTEKAPKKFLRLHARKKWMVILEKKNQDKNPYFYEPLSSFELLEDFSE